MLVSPSCHTTRQVIALPLVSLRCVAVLGFARCRSFLSHRLIVGTNGTRQKSERYRELTGRVGIHFVAQIEKLGANLCHFLIISVCNAIVNQLLVICDVPQIFTDSCGQRCFPRHLCLSHRRVDVPTSTTFFTALERQIDRIVIESADVFSIAEHFRDLHPHAFTGQPFTLESESRPIAYLERPTRSSDSM